MKTFHDHFSRDSEGYAKFRPGYPPALFAWLATLPARRELAWDCATGTGQAATLLAPYFHRVVASDPSLTQIRAATRRAGVHYLAATGEASALAPGAVDLVTVAQAFHWLDRDRFYLELDRVIAPGGVFAAWTYGMFRSIPEVDAVLDDFYHHTVGPYWPAERVHVEEGYRTFRIPIEETPAPPFAIEADLTLPQLLGFIRTWSAVGRYTADRGTDPVMELTTRLVPAWGDPDAPRHLVWPLTIRGGRWRRTTGRAA